MVDCKNFVVRRGLTTNVTRSVVQGQESRVILLRQAVPPKEVRPPRMKVAITNNRVSHLGTAFLQTGKRSINHAKPNGAQNAITASRLQGVSAAPLGALLQPITGVELTYLFTIEDGVTTRLVKLFPATLLLVVSRAVPQRQNGPLAVIYRARLFRGAFTLPLEGLHLLAFDELSIMAHAKASRLFVAVAFIE